MHIECKGSPKAETILRKKNKFGGYIFPDFKTYYKGTVTKTVQYWQKDIHRNQKTEWRAQKQIHAYMVHWSSTRVPRRHSGVKTVSSTNTLWETWHPHAKEHSLWSDTT